MLQVFKKILGTGHWSRWSRVEPGYYGIFVKYIWEKLYPVEIIRGQSKKRANSIKANV